MIFLKQSRLSTDVSGGLCGHLADHRLWDRRIVIPGICPACFGKRERRRVSSTWLYQESVALSVWGLPLIRDIEPGEAGFILSLRVNLCPAMQMIIRILPLYF